MASERKTTEDLRGILFETLEDLKAGKIKPNEASIIAKLSDSIIKSADIELKHKLVMKKIPGTPATPLALTSDAQVEEEDGHEPEGNSESPSRAARHLC